MITLTYSMSCEHNYFSQILDSRKYKHIKTDRKRKITITYLTKFYRWSMEKIEYMQTLLLSYKDRYIISKKTLA